MSIFFSFFANVSVANVWFFVLFTSSFLKNVLWRVFDNRESICDCENDENCEDCERCEIWKWTIKNLNQIKNVSFDVSSATRLLFETDVFDSAYDVVKSRKLVMLRTRNINLQILRISRNSNEINLNLHVIWFSFRFEKRENKQVCVKLTQACLSLFFDRVISFLNRKESGYKQAINRAAKPP